MTIDKFGQHISKRYQVDTSTLENTIFSNIENRILNKFKGDQKYVENKIIENFESNFKDDINNLNKRLNENIEDIENAKKKIKIFEDKTIQEYDDKILKHEDNLNILGTDMKNEISEIKTIIKGNNQSTIDKVKDDISKEFVSKFQNFTNMLNDRVALEVTNFGKVHDDMNKNINNIDRSVKLQALVNKNHNAKVVELEEKVMEASNKADVVVSKDIVALTERIKTLEDSSNNITRNSNKIEEVLTQLHNLELKNQTNVDLKLLPEIKSLSERIQIIVKEREKEDTLNKIAKNNEKIGEITTKLQNFEIIEERLLTKLNKSFKTMVVDLENTLTDKIKLIEASIKDNKEEIESFKAVYDESRVNVIRTTTGLKTLKEQFEKQKKEIEDFVRNTSAESINKVIEAREEFNSAIKELKKEIFIDKAVMETEINVKCNEQKNKIQEIDDKINKAITSINDIKDKVDKVVK